MFVRSCLRTNVRASFVRTFVCAFVGSCSRAFLRPEILDYLLPSFVCSVFIHPFILFVPISGSFLRTVDCSLDCSFVCCKFVHSHVGEHPFVSSFIHWILDISSDTRLNSNYSTQQFNLLLMEFSLKNVWLHKNGFEVFFSRRRALDWRLIANSILVSFSGRGLLGHS